MGIWAHRIGRYMPMRSPSIPPELSSTNSQADVEEYRIRNVIWRQFNHPLTNNACVELLLPKWILFRRVLKPFDEIVLILTGLNVSLYVMMARDGADGDKMLELLGETTWYLLITELIAVTSKLWPLHSTNLEIFDCGWYLDLWYTGLTLKLSYICLGNLDRTQWLLSGWFSN